jgi:small subunit ribosomal protein S15
MNKENLVVEFGGNSKNSGCTEVQVALITARIKQLTDHCQRHPKDVSTNRGLLKLVCQRRGLLTYLERANRDSYKNIINRLGLKR